MKAKYEDILGLTDEVPQWYDENGVPRYAPFHPELSPNIYSKEVILLLIECQYCQRELQVEMNYHIGTCYHPGFVANVKKKLENPGDEVFIAHYGDPPIHGCIGDTMNSTPMRILQFWTRVNMEWTRIEEYEIVI